MKVTNLADHVIDDATCKADTGRTLTEWFAELDTFDGLKKGRRDSVQHLLAITGMKDVWWPTTIYVEYEKHHNVIKKDGLLEGYTICCTKKIIAPVTKIYATWTNQQA